MRAQGWNPRKLDQLGFVGRGKSKHRPRNDPSLYDGKYPFFQTGDIKAASFYLTRYSQTYNEKGLAQSKLWDPGTLCITIAANIAETAILGVSGCFPDSVVGFIADPDKADVRFIKYYIDVLKRQMQSISAGTTQDNLSVDKLLTFDLCVPSVALQRHIADVLATYDELIDNCERRIRILDEMARTLYREWFVRFRYPGHERVPLVDSPLGRIPKGWRVERAGSLGEEVRRGVPKGALEEQVPYVGLEHIPRRSLALDAWENTTELGSNKLRFERGEVLFGKIRPYFHKVSVAPFDGVCSADTIVISPRDSTYYGLMVALVSSDAFVAEASVAANGAKMPRANWTVMSEAPVVLPPEGVARTFDGYMRALLAAQQNFVFRIENLRKTRDLLLPRLLSGQLKPGDAA